MNRHSTGWAYARATKPITINVDRVYDWAITLLAVFALFLTYSLLGN
jgi:hypothetical protein